MIVTKTPLRVSFFGGGSDIPEFYKEHGGLVVSSTINSYIFIAAHRCVAPHLKVVYSQLELEHNLDDVKHDRVREVLRNFNINSNIEIASFSNIPTKGTGLGSSSTFTVGLIKAIMEMQGEKYSAGYLAELASIIEIKKCGEPIGKQDQYASAYGGFNVYRFQKNGDVFVQPFVNKNVISQLQNNLLCFNTGIVRQASSVLSEQVEKLKNNINIDNTKRICDMAEEAIELLSCSKLDEFGMLLDKSWQIKKQLSSNITNSYIDKMYDEAVSAGALGGKILGAGGGGYLLLYVPKERQDKVLEIMKGYPRFDFKFTNEGSKVEMNSELSD
jgi:D-glycero-alpha-D-manno-heptose-7-phosphate kinase